MNFACTICQEDLFFGDDDVSIKSTICGHVYHSQCLLQWMTRSSTCPHCRKILSDNNVFKLNFSVGGTTTNTHWTRISEAEERIVALKDSLDLKDIKLQEMKENYTRVNLVKERLTKRMIELQNHMQRISSIEKDLSKELGVKSKQLEEMQLNYTGEKLANEQLSIRIVELENRIRDLTNGELDGESELEMNCKKLQEIETQYTIAKRENAELRFEIQSLKEIGKGNIKLTEQQNNETIKLISDQEMGQTLREEIDKLITHLRAEQQKNTPTTRANEKMRVFEVELATLKEEIEELKIKLASKMDKNDPIIAKKPGQGSRSVLRTEAEKLKIELNSDQHDDSISTNLTASDRGVFQITYQSLLCIVFLFFLVLFFLYFRWRE